VRILFTLARNGTVLDVFIQASSGSAALDQEAVATLLRGQPLPPIPAGLPDPMDFSFDIEFSPPSLVRSG
jgi:protein TonB